MSICIIIDGLLMEGDPSSGSYCPDLVRLAAVGRGGLLDLGPGSVSPATGRVYLDLLLADDVWSSTKDLPLGYLSALGIGLEPDCKRTWAALGLLHLFQKTNKLLFFSPERVGLTLAEKEELITSLREEFNLQGWTLHWAKEWGVALISSQSDLAVCSTPISILEGESFFDHLPQGADANTLLALVTTGQMLLARNPLNQQRIKLKKLPLNTPWVWGVGRGDELPSARISAPNRGSAWSSEPMVAGLARLAVLQPLPFDEKDGFSNDWIEQVASVALEQSAVVHFQAPAQLAALGMLSKRQAMLEQIDQRFIAPLATRLAEEGGKMVVTTPARLNSEGKPVAGPVPWLAGLGAELGRKKRFWQRKSLGEGTAITPHLFRKEWTV